MSTDTTSANPHDPQPEAISQVVANDAVRHPTKLTVPDFVSIGVFTALYFLLVFIAALVAGIFNPALSSFAPAVAALIAGSVYMLLIARVRKFGAITIMGCVMGIFFFVSGHFPLSFLPLIICALAADLIAMAGRYRNKTALLISYIVFSYGEMGPALPLYFMKNAYIANLKARGKSAAYIDSVFANVNMTYFIITMTAVLVCGIIGGPFGLRMMRKHFAKAGVA